MKSVPADLRGFIDEINERYQRIDSDRKEHVRGEEKYRLIADNMNDVLWITDLSPKLLYVSPSCISLTGHTDEELLEKRVEEFMTPETYALCVKRLGQELNAEQESGLDPDRNVFADVEYIRKDGSKVWAELRVRFLRENGKPVGLLGVSRDITMRRDAETKLAMSEERYRSILEALEDGYYEVDLRGRYVAFNISFCRLMGYSPDEILGMSFKDLVPKESHESLFKLFHAVYTRNLPERITRDMFIRKDGSRRYAEGSVSLRLNPAGEKIGFCGIIRDITEKVMMEQALQENEKKWRVLYNNIPGGSFIIDGNLTILDANAITCSVTGYEYQELVGEKCSIICDYDRDACSCPIQGEGAGKIDNIETFLRAKDGRRVPIIKSAQRIGGASNDMVIANFHDISRQKEIEEALRASEYSLRKRNDAIEKDLQTAQMIQRSLLSISMPELDWIKVGYRYLPLEAVGGDYFSITPLREGGLGVFIGDVSSHGVTAALYLSLVKATSERICRGHALEPLNFINMLNAELYGHMPLSFLTATYGVFGMSHGGETPFTFSSAGHPYPILCRAGRDDAEYVYCKGTLIGMFDDLVFAERTINLKTRDRIFLYTDGIPETENDKRDIIGYDNLPGLIGRCSGDDLESTLDAIMDEIHRFKGGTQLADDIILLGFEVAG